MTTKDQTSQMSETSQTRQTPPRPRRSPPWSTLSRRRFLGGVLAAAGAVTVKAALPASTEPPRSAGRTRWIGHC